MNGVLSQSFLQMPEPAAYMHHAIGWLAAAPGGVFTVRVQ